MRYSTREPIQQIALFGLCLLVFVGTAAPSLYTYDSAEFVIGAATLGIVHAPGYPLYLMIAHLFTLVPIGDVPFRVNLLSAVCLALTVPVLFTLIKRLRVTAWAAAAGALSVSFCYLVWSAAIRAEVYTPQLLTLAITCWAVVRVTQKPDTSSALIAGVAYGIALAMHPASILFAPAVLIAFLNLRLRWTQRLAAGGIAVIAFVLPLLYFPLRYAADPALNLAGQYAADGTFQRVDLTTLSGILWVLRGQQFSSLFFANGVLPSLDQAGKFALQFWRGFLGIGILLGAGGVVVMPRRVRWLWLVCFVPYAYFFAAYGAPDSETMYGPALMTWGVAISFGLDALLQHIEEWLWLPFAAALPLVLLLVNLPLLNLRTDDHVRLRAEIILDSFPPGSPAGYVFGNWFEIVPMQYLQIVEGQRPDLRLYNEFLFDDDTLIEYVSTIDPVAFVGSQFNPRVLQGGGSWQPIQLALPSLEHPHDLAPEIAGYRLIR